MASESEVKIKFTADTEEAEKKIAALAAAKSALDPKPGWRSSEFWGVTVAWILSALLASGILPDGGAAVKVASFIAAALASVGYAAGRSYVKGK